MEVLNLDALARQVRTVTVNSVQYAVKEMGVGDFIDAQEEAKRLEANKGDLAEDMKSTIRHIKRVIPAMPDEVIKGLSMPMLGALVSFINGALVEQGQNPSPAAEAPAEGDAKN